MSCFNPCREQEGLGPLPSHSGRGQQLQGEGRRRYPSEPPSRLNLPLPLHPYKLADPCCHHACGPSASGAAGGTAAAPAVAPSSTWLAAPSASTGARNGQPWSHISSAAPSYSCSSATTAPDSATSSSAAGLHLSCPPYARDCHRASPLRRCARVPPTPAVRHRTFVSRTVAAPLAAVGMLRSSSTAATASNAALLHGSFCTMAGPAGPCCPAGDAVKSERLRMQLSSVGERFIGFKTSIADDTRRRRLIEEQRFQEVKEGIVRVEKALNGEIKRRVEANRTLQRVAEQMANEMLERLQTRIAKQIEKLTVSLDVLITRCEGLEKNLVQMKGETPTKLAQETASLTTELMALKEQFELERKGRADREQTLVKRLNELHYGLDAKLEAEIALRQEQLNHLKREAERLTRGDDSHEQFRAFIIEELQSLKGGLALATQAREQSDDEIIHAINQYTTALQKGLRNITSR